ncbi:hypothetical protein PGB90_001123 [Kerria lacca]
MSYCEKVVLITGAAAGIGRATAIKFANVGAKLALTDRNMDDLEKVGKECELVSKNKPLLVKAELTNEKDIGEIMEKTINNFSYLNILINNAGVFHLGSIEQTTLEAFDRIFNINVRAVFQLTALAVPHLTKTKGIIVNTSSRCGKCSTPGMLAYSMSKSAIDQMTRCLALELSEKGIRVNSVNPGAIKTDVLMHNKIDLDVIKNINKLSSEKCPLKRMGEAEEIADGILFLCSNQASFITGVNLSIDGGSHVVSG